MCKSKDKAYLPTPIWMKRKRRTTIEVDSCCEKVLLHLWKQGIDTLHHCCGHLSSERPWIILAAGCTIGISTVEKLIKEVDNRDWCVT